MIGPREPTWRALAEFHEQQAIVSRDLAKLMLEASPGRRVALESAARHEAWASAVRELIEPNQLAETLSQAMAMLLVAGNHDGELYARLKTARDSARNLAVKKETAA